MKPDLPFNPQTSVGVEAMFSASDSPSANAPVQAASGSPSRQRVLHSQQLFGAANEVLIEHAGFTYRLRITQANKLILTK